MEEAVKSSLFTMTHLYVCNWIPKVRGSYMDWFFVTKYSEIFQYWVPLTIWFSKEFKFDID